MDYSAMVDVLAPCGLNCSRCAEYKNGEIKQSSEKLLFLLGDYQRIASMKEKTNPAFTAYQQFLEILNILAQGPCGGCRSDENYCPVECAAKNCYREKGVEFCFQCSAFPCDKEIPARERWLKMNERMLGVGVEQFFAEQSKLPRY